MKAAPGNKKPYYALLEDMIEPIIKTLTNSTIYGTIISRKEVTQCQA